MCVLVFDLYNATLHNTKGNTTQNGYDVRSHSSNFIIPSGSEGDSEAYPNDKTSKQWSRMWALSHLAQKMYEVRLQAER